MSDARFKSRHAQSIQKRKQGRQESHLASLDQSRWIHRLNRHLSRYLALGAASSRWVSYLRRSRKRLTSRSWKKRTMLVMLMTRTKAFKARCSSISTWSRFASRILTAPKKKRKALLTTSLVKFRSPQRSQLNQAHLSSRGKVHVATILPQTTLVMSFHSSIRSIILVLSCILWTRASSNCITLIRRSTLSTIAIGV